MGLASSPTLFFLLLLLKHFKGLLSPAKNCSFNNSFAACTKKQGHWEICFPFSGLNNLQRLVVKKN